MAKTYVLKVAATGKVEREEFRADDALEQLQKAVGGWIERVPVPMMKGHDLFVDEEGMMKRLPVNGLLTRFVHGRLRNTARFIVGDGVFAAHGDDGETRGLTEAECADFEASLVLCGARTDD